MPYDRVDHEDALVHETEAELWHHGSDRIYDAKGIARFENVCDMLELLEYVSNQSRAASTAKTLPMAHPHRRQKATMPVITQPTSPNSHSEPSPPRPCRRSFRASNLRPTKVVARTMKAMLPFCCCCNQWRAASEISSAIASPGVR